MDARDHRLTGLLDVLRFENGATISDLAARLGVSAMTVRRDLSILERQKLVRILHGSVIFNPAGTTGDGKTEYSLSAAETRHAEEKRRIGRAAASLIKADEVILIDTGTTTQYVAEFLPIGVHFTVICYNLNILLEATKLKDVEILFAGGYYHDNTAMFVSPEGIQLVRNNRAGTAFVSAAGVSPRLGLTCANAYETETKRAAIGSSLHKVLLADSSKFGRVQPYHFADLSEFDTIITDTGIDERYRKELRKMGVEVIEA
ncbi:MAG TPA: DeoR/GlpR family DNA-binding transcription regulator [Spirochaetia bacterium]|nr:DeoR/GlpR family DNA-binding transcription regulator [Spirochaetia bacterium]